MVISQELIDIIACPQCKGDLELTSEQSWFICHSCALKYPIKDDIPVMLIEEASALNP
jgi:uncharacterized protein YbaR (Trm112 family)